MLHPTPAPLGGPCPGKGFPRPGEEVIPSGMVCFLPHKLLVLKASENNRASNLIFHRPGSWFYLFKFQFIFLSCPNICQSISATSQAAPRVSSAFSGEFFFLHSLPQITAKPAFTSSALPRGHNLIGWGWCDGGNYLKVGLQSILLFSLDCLFTWVGKRNLA